MSLIITADQRREQQRRHPIKIALFGPSGIGKTTQARTLQNQQEYLFLNLEAGDLAIDGEEDQISKKLFWEGDITNVRVVAASVGAHPWDICKAIALLIGGHDPSAQPDGDYSASRLEQVRTAFNNPNMSKYKGVFVDSITVASRWCFSWCQQQPAAFSEKTGKPDSRGAYGLLGQEMVRWLTHLQHAPLDVITVGILDQDKDELNRITWSPQVEGSKTARELPGIWDEVITLTNLPNAENPKILERRFVCHQQNQWGFPAKDRSGTLDLTEPAHLGNLITKIRAGKRIDTKLQTA